MERGAASNIKITNINDMRLIPTLGRSPLFAAQNDYFSLYVYTLYYSEDLPNCSQ